MIPSEGTRSAYQFQRSADAQRRARSVVAGSALWPSRLLGPGEPAPAYIVRAKGGRCWDVDGNEFIDLTLGFGPIILGYADPAVDAAVERQIADGTVFTLDNTLQHRLAEMLRERIPSAEMAAFFKTGSDATTAALRMARRYTGRRRVACCGYHGWHDWCLPTADYVPDGLVDQVVPFAAWEPETLAQVLDACPGQFAAVIVAPETVVPPVPATFAELHRLARRHGAVFVLDEIKTGIRTRPGTIQQHLGISADLTTLSKALANGYAISAVVGRREIMSAADGIHVAGTYHGDAIGMAAAIATLTEVDARGVQAHIWSLGEYLIAGLQQLADAHGVPADACAVPLPPMPLLVFRHPRPHVNDRMNRAFFAHMARHGVLMHPRHMWFVAASHTRQDFDRVLEVADDAMAAARRALETSSPAQADAAVTGEAAGARIATRTRAYRAAFIGCGMRASMHALAYQAIEGARIVACCDVDESRARAFADAFSVRACYRDATDLLRDAGPDILHILTPPRMRRDLLVLAAEHGVPLVIVEKPIALDTTDYRALRALAASASTRFVANHQLRFHPTIRRLVEAVTEERIGRIRHIEASARLPISDQGAHLVDLARAFTGDAPMASVFAAATGADALTSTHPGPDMVLCDLRFVNGDRAAIACGPHAPSAGADARPYRHKRIAVYGTRGFVHWQMNRWEQFTERGGYEAGQVDYGNDDVAAQAVLVEAAIKSLEAGGPGHPTRFDASLEVVGAILGCYESALTGSTVALPFAGEEDLLPKLLGASLLGPLFL